MRSRLCILTLAVLLAPATGSTAATIFTFEVTGTTDFSTSSIQSFSFSPQGSGGTLELTKEIDLASVNILQAVTQGTQYLGAAFIAYDNVVSPETELFRYTLNDLVFTSVSLNGLIETVSMMAATATFVPAGGATIFTFGVNGTTSFDTDTIHSYSFVPSGTGGTLSFTKAIDSSSDDFQLAVAQGSLFAGATFIGYDGSISPEAEVFRYLLSNIFFSSASLNLDAQTVTLQAERATLVEVPASAPEPGVLSLLLTGVALLAHRRRRPLR